MSAAQQQRRTRRLPVQSGLSSDAAVAWLDLFTATAQTMTPCRVDPDPFTSEDRGDRAEAAQACRGCPVLDLCATFADLNDEPAHVWGGRDRTPRTHHRAVTEPSEVVA